MNIRFNSVGLAENPVASSERMSRSEKANLSSRALAILSSSENFNLTMLTGRHQTTVTKVRDVKALVLDMRYIGTDLRTIAPILPRRNILCGRLDQSDVSRLIMNFDWADELFNRSQASDNVNASPGTFRPLLHLDGGALFADDVHWGYRSTWAEASGKIPMAINTRLDKIENRYWKPLLKAGRAIVPANGWYEWTGEKGSKQPWHIHRIDRSPLYLAALVGTGKDETSKTANGFTIITAAADGGLIDVHDRRPVVLTAADAAMWMKPDLPPEEAAHLLTALAAPPESFAWHAVDRAIGNVRNQDPRLAAALSE